MTTPKTTFSGTTIATMISDSESAEIAAGVVICSQKATRPSSNVRTRIIPIGTSSSTPR